MLDAKITRDDHLDLGPAGFPTRRGVDCASVSGKINEDGISGLDPSIVSQIVERLDDGSASRFCIAERPNM